MSKKSIMQKKIFFHNSTVSFCVNYIILTPQNIYFFNSQNIYFICLKNRLCRHVHNSTVLFCVNYIILLTQNIYFFISQNIYFICKKNDYTDMFIIRQYRFMLII